MYGIHLYVNCINGLIDVSLEDILIELFSVSSLKGELDKYLSTIPNTPCVTNYENSLENSSHTNPPHLTGVHPV